MKKISTVLFALLAFGIIKGQTKLATDTYMYLDPLHESTQYVKVLFKSNGTETVNDAFIEIFEKFGFEATNYYSLFPPLREYSQEEINEVLKKNTFDLYMVINTSSESFTTGATFSSFQVNNSAFGYSTTNRGLSMNTSLFFFDSKSGADPFCRVNCSVLSGGGITRRDVPLAMKTLHNTLIGLVKHDVLYSGKNRGKRQKK